MKKVAAPQGPPLTSLPLWEPWLPGIDKATVTARSPDCQRCPRYMNAATVCMVPRGDPGGLLVVGGHPTKQEDALGQAFAGNIAASVEKLVAENWQGPVAWTYALGCAGGKPDGEVIEACRGHVLDDVLHFAPTRILLLGKVAAEGVLGIAVDGARTRRAWAIVQGIPTFVVLDPQEAAYNRFVKKHLAADVRWALTSDPPVAPQGETRLLVDPIEAEAFVRSLDVTKPTVVDVENFPKSPWSPDLRLLCVGFCQDPQRPVVIPGALAQEPNVRAAVQQWLADPRHAKIGQSIKYDRQVLLRTFGQDMAGIESDTMLIARLREPEAPAGLGPLSWLIGFGGHKEFADEDDEEGGAKKFAAMPLDLLHAYNGRDTASTLLVHRWQTAHVHAEVQQTWRSLIGPAFDALAHVERWGVALSEDAVRAYDRWLGAREDILSRQLYSYSEVPADFSPGSPKQVSALLFTKLGLKVQGTTKTGAPSTDKEAMKALAAAHPIVPLLSELSEVRKQRSTYGLSMLGHAGFDGRVHTTFKLVRTGRLSSSAPNMQNVTKPEQPGDPGEWARGCFIASPGHKFVNLDYAQMELRVAAMLAGDEVMAAAFETGIDFHSMTGAKATGIDPASVTPEIRRIGKALNFGIVYGQTEYGIAAKLGCTPERAGELLESLLGAYKRLAEWRRRQIADAEANGEIRWAWESWKFRRSVAEIGSTGSSREADRRRKHWRNVAINTPVQGIANCFSLASITEAVRWCLEERPQVRLVMTVHDSLLFECPEGMVDEVVSEGRRIMLSWPSGIVKLKVDAEVGDDWGRMTKL